MNGAFFDPRSKHLIVTAKFDDISLTNEGDEITIMVENLDEGIEIPQEDERIWRAV